MSDSPDLIDKTDALLSRYRGNPKPSPENDFPVLTDIYGQPETLVSPAYIPNGVPSGGVDVPAVRYSDSQERRTELLVEEVLLRLAPHIDDALGNSLTQVLDEMMRNKLAELADKIRDEVENRIKVAVSQAIQSVVSENK